MFALLLHMNNNNNTVVATSLARSGSGLTQAG